MLLRLIFSNRGMRMRRGRRKDGSPISIRSVHAGA